MDIYKVGLDIGSTTAKIIVLDKSERNVLFYKYERHQAKVQECLLAFFHQLKEQMGDVTLSINITGSVGMGIAEKYSLPFVQEVVAAAQYIRRNHPGISSMIDIGGEDAKVVFFQNNQATDLRMNGNCAGGTGAFIDQMAILLGVSMDELNGLALRATRVHPIASRCGVFCKTDIQNLIAKNIPKEDIAASIFHAVTVQTIVTLAHGCDIVAPILLCGGPLTFIPALRKSFANYLQLSEENDFLLPEKSNLIPAWGAALAENSRKMKITELTGLLENLSEKAYQPQNSLPPFFKDETEYLQWKDRLAQYDVQRTELTSGIQQATIGIDSGSTTTKIVVLDENNRILYSYYPKVQRGEIVKVESHCRFTMLPEKEYGNVKLPAMHYTPDFVLTYADGTVEVVEVKSKFTRRQQRDYIHRRRMFIDLVAEPRGWRFVEHITPDTAAEIKAWKKCAQQTERKG